MPIPKKFIRRQTPVEAMYLLSQESGKAVLAWILENNGEASFDGSEITIYGPDSYTIAHIGDYVIKDSKGHFYSCKGFVFNEMYEAL